VYVSLPESAAAEPKRLVGWAKVQLDPQQSRGFQRVTVSIDPNSAGRPLSIWNVARNDWETPSGVYTIFVGASSQDIRLTGTVQIQPSAASGDLATAPR
jgi:beta-glucosidase